MTNLLVPSRPRVPPVESLERELKFVLPNVRAPLALGLLRRCRPDPDHPVGTVSSIYYDDPGLGLLREKINSDYLKTKVRLRWYDQSPDTHGFIEAKFRVGDRRDKIRISTTHTTQWLARTPLHDPELLTIPERLRQAGVRVDPRLQPLLTVRYRRHRFIEPITGSRVSLDFDIAGPRANRSMLPGGGLVALPTAVVEVKGDETELPAPLGDLLTLGCRRESFSKYAAVYRALTSGPSGAGSYGNISSSLCPNS